MGGLTGTECGRARTLVSLGLDGELSELEAALLRAHLGRCGECAGFVRDTAGLTRQLRAAPLERPRRESMPVRRRRAGLRTLQLAAAAAAVALAAGLGSLAGSLATHHPVQRSASAELTPQALRVAARSVFRAQRLPGTRLQRSEPV